MMNYNYPAPWLYASCRKAVQMARAYPNDQRLRVLWQERAADYRETIVDKMRQRQGWSLAERCLGARAPRCLGGAG